MKASLFARLEKTINDWVAKNCEEDDWPFVAIGDDTANCMTVAAAAVLDACAESQLYVKENDL